MAQFFFSSFYKKLSQRCSLKRERAFQKKRLIKIFSLPVCSANYRHFAFTINFYRSIIVNRLKGNWPPDRIWGMLGRVGFVLLSTGPVACNYTVTALSPESFEAQRDSNSWGARRYQVLVRGYLMKISLKWIKMNSLD